MPAAAQSNAQGSNRQGQFAELGSNPLRITAVDAKGPAAELLQEGDLISAINGKPAPAAIADTLKGMKPKTVLKLTVYRDIQSYMAMGYPPQPTEISVTLGTKAGQAWLGISVSAMGRGQGGFGGPAGAGRQGTNGNQPAPGSAAPGGKGAAAGQARPAPSGNPPAGDRQRPAQASVNL